MPFNDLTEQMNAASISLLRQGAEFTIDIEPTLPPSILTDQKRLQQTSRTYCRMHSSSPRRDGLASDKGD